MKKILFAFVSVVVCVIQIQGMKRSVEETYDMPIGITNIPSELTAQIVSWCNPATRNILMRVSTYFKFFASSSNSILLAAEDGAPIHFLDSLKHALLYIKDNNNTMLKYLFAHKELEQSKDFGVNYTIVASIFCKKPDRFQFIRSILPKTSAGNVTFCLEKVLKNNPDRDSKKLAFDFSMMAGIIHNAKNLPDSLTAICNDPRKVEKLETCLPLWLMGSILSNKSEAMRLFLDNKECSQLLKPGQDLFGKWPKWLQYACMHQEKDLFNSMLNWLCVNRMYHFLHIVIYQSALKIIDINKHQYLELLMDAGKKYLEAEKFNSLVEDLLSYAYEYKKQDSNDLLARKYLNG